MSEDDFVFVGDNVAVVEPDGLGFSFPALGLADEAIALHGVQYGFLPPFGFFGVFQRVKGAGCVRQSGYEGCFFKFEDVGRFGKQFFADLFDTGAAGTEIGVVKVNFQNIVLAVFAF